MSFTSKVRYQDAAVFFRRRFLSPFNGGTEGGLRAMRLRTKDTDAPENVFSI